jgi:DNA-binding MarR family transcriptional regulator
MPLDHVQFAHDWSLYMPDEKSMQPAHISARLRELHGALLEIISVINQPQRDVILLAEAGVRLDPQLFPLLVGVQHFGPIGVLELADRAGRNYTTVSRQLLKLDNLGLIERRAAADRRVHEAVLSPKGLEITGRIDAARQKLGRSIFATWSEIEIDTFARLMRKFADGIKG